jgi:ketosteroid isomerase-like protein
MREAVSQDARPLRARPSGRRKFDERLTVAAPWLVRLVATIVQRLPPRSGLRQRFLARTIRQQYEAFRRRDFEVVLSSHDPGVEVLMPREFGTVTGADLDEVYRGYDGLRSLWAQWLEPWETFHFDPERLIDLGDEILVLLTMVGRGRGSGVEVRQPVAQLYALRNGLVARQTNFWEWDQGLAAAGLPTGDNAPSGRAGAEPPPESSSGPGTSG